MDCPCLKAFPLIAVDHVQQNCVTDSSGTLDILRDIDFTLGSPRTLAIVGASGSGKNALLSIMAGWIHPAAAPCAWPGRLFALDEDGRAQLRGHKWVLFPKFSSSCRT